MSPLLLANKQLILKALVVLTFGLIGIQQTVNGQQVILSHGGSAQELAETIAGSGVQLLNPVITCADSAYGKYSIYDVPNFPTSKGVVLTTGHLDGLVGPNNSQSTTTEWTTPGDPTISAITNHTSFDGCALEFDVVPVGDTLRFNFTFASEEYREYVGTPFNDAFGFFISGPGIVGDPGIGNLSNIALIPNTTNPVEINSVNDGNPDIGYPPTNPQYFQYNPLGFTNPLQYDGWTLDLVAERVVNPCDTFRLKLVIADVSDREWDSAVFIEAIESNAVTVDAVTDALIDQLIEGCNNGVVTLTRNPVTDQDLIVTYYLQGTAINGVDYQQIGLDPDPGAPKFATIPANQESVSINVIPLGDGIPEPDETMIFYLGNPFCIGTVQDSLIIVIQDSLNVSISPQLAFVCLGDSLTFDTETDGLTYHWSPPTYLDDPLLLEPTSTPTSNITYNLAVFAGACSSVSSAQVNVTDVVLTADITNNLCHGEINGSVNLTTIGGTSPITYEWVGPNGFTADTEDISDLGPGTYAVLVTDRDGCTETLSITITEPDELLVTLSSPTFIGGTNISCFQATDGQAQATVSGGTPPYTYQWDDLASQTTAHATNLSAGTYTLTVMDNNGCSFDAIITLTQPLQVGASLISRTDVLCTGDNTGSILIEPNGGTPTYSVLWNSTPPQIGLNPINLPAGIFSAIITDINGCTGGIEVEIQEPDFALSGTISTSSILCNGDDNGTATASISGGVPPYHYSWSSAPGIDANQIIDQSAGSYLLTVIDANGCTLSIPYNIVQPSPLTVNLINAENIDCYGSNSGSIVVNGSGGVSPYTYSWDINPPNSDPSISGLSAGTYTVTLTDNNACVATLAITLSQPDSLIAAIQILASPTCFDASDGELEASATGGTAPYTYHWNTVPPTFTSILTGLEGGTYEVTITDDNSCEVQAAVSLIAPDPILINLTIENVLCNGASTGSATASVTGGTEPYAYQWNDPSSQTTQTASGLSAGNYTIEITDANGCFATLPFIITEPTDPLAASIDSHNDVLCFGVNDGSATALATGGSGSYTYQWNDPAMQTTATASNLAPGDYSVTITDNNGCPNSIILNVTIDGPTEDIAINAIISTFNGGYNVSCSGGQNAFIDITLNGGTGPYTVLWDLPGINTATTEDLSGIEAGTYIITVTDFNGCMKDTTLILTQPLPLDVVTVTTPSLCFGQPEGTISITIEGGVDPYLVEWTGPNGFTSSDLTLIDLEGGVYNLQITDANGCIYTNSATVTQPEDILITIDDISDYNGFNTSCSYSSDGSIEISATGGLMPYIYQWNAVNNPGFSDQTSVSNLAPGTYEIVVEDGNGCIQSLIIPLLSPDTINIAFDALVYPNGFNISCFGAMDGSIDALVSGGLPSFDYTWTGPGGFGPVNDQLINNLDAGEYLLQVVDQNGCTAEETILLTQPNPFSIAVTSPTINGFNLSCAGAGDGSIDLVFIGGASPINVAWIGPNGYVSSNEDLFNLIAGTYCVDATDDNGCTMSECITLTEPPAVSVVLDPIFYLNGMNLNCDDSQDGQIDATISGGVSPYVLSWTGPLNYTNTTEDIIGLIAGTYCLTVTDASGCSSTTCVTLIAPPPIQIVAETIQQPLCNGDSNGFIDVSILGGDPAYTFTWSGPNGFAANSEDIAGLAIGVYCLNLSDANGCTAEMCFTITEPNPVQLSLTTSLFNGGVQIDCNGANTGSITAITSGGTTPFTFSWIGPNGFTANTATIQSLLAGNYCVDITDANGCMQSQCVDLNEPVALVNNPIVTLPTCGDGTFATVDLQTSGGISPYTYNWSNGLTTEVVSLDQGEYTVITSDENDCEINNAFAIILPSQIDIFLSSPTTSGFNIACNGGNTGSINLQVFNGSGNLNILWNGPNGFTSTDANLTNLIAGTYCVEITDEFGCMGSECITLSEPSLLTITLTTSETNCNGSADGSITATIIGGVPTYQISWTGPNGFMETGSSISGLEAGNYCATVTDHNGCVAMECIEVTSPLTLDVSLISPEFGGVNISCFGDNSGTIYPEVIGGTAPYDFSWTGPGGYLSSNDTIFNLFVGTYCLIVTDANGCSSSTCITLTEAPGISIDIDVFEYPNGFNTSCGQVCDGSLTLTTIGGAQPITYAWIGPNGFSSDQPVLNNLCAGVYHLTTTDAIGCEQAASIIITQPPLLLIDLQSPVFGGGNEISCFGESNGSIFSNVTGGIPPYDFNWDGPSGFTSTAENIENLPAGTYSLNLTDDFGCTASASITLNEPDEPLTASTDISSFNSGSNISCNGAEDGWIQATGNGGTPPYSFNWNGPDGFISSDANISGLAPGIYTLVIEDANSCVFTSNITLTEPDLPLITSLEVLLGLPCNDSETGSLLVNAEGGIEPYGILWIGTGGFTASTFQIDNLTAGTYSYVVTDLNGCTSSGAVTLTAPAPIAITGLVQTANCLSPTGSISTVVTGGTAPYTYSWSNGDDTQNISDLLPGNYSLTVIDDNGCISVESFDVISSNSLVVSADITELNCFEDQSGQILLTIVTGVEPITYSWIGPNGFTADTPLVSELAAGEYVATISDAIGCTISEEFIVSEPNPLELQALTSPLFNNGFNLSGYESNDGTIDAPQVSGGIPDYTFIWTSDNGYSSTDENAQLNLAAGTYVLLVTDNNGCSTTDTLTLTQPVPIEIPNGISPNGDGLNDGFVVLGLDDFPENKLLVYNRWGNLVFEESNYRNDRPWIGTNKGGEQLPEGTYFIIVELTGHENLNGYLEIRR